MEYRHENQLFARKLARKSRLTAQDRQRAIAEARRGGNPAEAPNPTAAGRVDALGLRAKGSA